MHFRASGVHGGYSNSFTVLDCTERSSVAFSSVGTPGVTTRTQRVYKSFVDDQDYDTMQNVHRYLYLRQSRHTDAASP